MYVLVTLRRDRVKMVKAGNTAMKTPHTAHTPEYPERRADLQLRYETAGIRVREQIRMSVDVISM